MTTIPWHSYHPASQGNITELPQDVATPLGYSLLLHLHQGHFAANSSARAAGFAAQSNITIAVHKVCAAQVMTAQLHV